MAVTLTSTGITFSNGTTQTTAASSGTTVTKGQVSTNFSTSDSTRYVTLTMQSSGMNFMPNCDQRASSYNSSPDATLAMYSSVPQAFANHCNNTSTPSVNYTSKVTYYQAFNNSSYNCTNAQVKYSYLTLS